MMMYVASLQIVLSTLLAYFDGREDTVNSKETWLVFSFSSSSFISFQIHL